MKPFAVTLLAADQFGDDGPKPGHHGIVIAEMVDPDADELWYQVVFKGFPGAVYNVSESMLTT